MDEKRFDKLEDKVDSLKEDFSEFKIDVKVQFSELKSDLNSHMNLVKRHIEGDEKIINSIKELLPLLPDIHKMAKDYNAENHLREKEKSNLNHKYDVVKLWATRVGLISGVVSLFALIGKFFF